jgi:hypothetical protein
MSKYKLMPEVPTEKILSNIATRHEVSIEEAGYLYSDVYDSAPCVECEPVLKVYRGEICYKSKADDQTYGMWCPVGYSGVDGLADGTNLYTIPQDQSAKIAELEAKLKVAEGALEAIAMTDKPSPYSFGFINQQTQARNALNKIRGE